VTTKAWFFALSNTNDATFRAWGADLSAAFAEVGLVKTADTGQINWTTVSRPATNTVAGYEIWRYADSSVFLKIEYGNGQSTNDSFTLHITVGQNSNGSGTLTGATSTRSLTVLSNSGISAAGTSRQSFLVYKDGFLGFLGYRNAFGGNIPLCFFAVCRTTDAAGAPDSRGITVYTTPTANLPRAQAVNFQTGVALSPNTTGDFVVIPMGITSSIIGIDTQCFLHWTALPLVLPNPYVATVISSEVPSGSTFSTTLVGTTPRTYVALDLVPHGSALGSTYKLAMLWE
jgi:hypothetical protein